MRKPRTPAEALRAFALGRHIEKRQFDDLWRRGWIHKKWSKYVIKEAFRELIRGDVLPPLQCPKCGAVHFPHGSDINACSQCHEMLTEADWLGERDWPIAPGFRPWE